MRSSLRSSLTLLVGLSIYPLACSTTTSQIEDYGQKAVDTSVHKQVDSVISPEEAIRRFRENIPTAVTQYSNGASSKDALIRKLVEGLTRQDTASLAKLVLSRAEFAYLYYPNHPQSLPPYELSPQLMWFQMIANSEKGLRRALREFGGQPLRPKYSCADSTTIQNGNQLWTKCAVEMTTGGRSPKPMVLFSAIIAKDGTYKFLSYSNNL